MTGVKKNFLKLTLDKSHFITEKAKELLEDTDTRIYRIAEETGFGKADYFINKFVQVYGITPNQYRMKFKKSGRGN